MLALTRPRVSEPKPKSVLVFQSTIVSNGVLQQRKSPMHASAGRARMSVRTVPRRRRSRATWNAPDGKDEKEQEEKKEKGETKVKEVKEVKEEKAQPPLGPIVITPYQPPEIQPSSSQSISLGRQPRKSEPLSAEEPSIVPPKTTKRRASNPLVQEQQGGYESDTKQMPADVVPTSVKPVRRKKARSETYIPPFTRPQWDPTHAILTAHEQGQIDKATGKPLKAVRNHPNPLAYARGYHKMETIINNVSQGYPSVLEASNKVQEVIDALRKETGAISDIADKQKFENHIKSLEIERIRRLSDASRELNYVQEARDVERVAEARLKLSKTATDLRSKALKAQTILQKLRKAKGNRAQKSLEQERQKAEKQRKALKGKLAADSQRLHDEHAIKVQNLDEQHRQELVQKTAEASRLLREKHDAAKEGLDAEIKGITSKLEQLKKQKEDEEGAIQQRATALQQQEQQRQAAEAQRATTLEEQERQKTSNDRLIQQQNQQLEQLQQALATGQTELNKKRSQYETVTQGLDEAEKALEAKTREIERLRKRAAEEKLEEEKLQAIEELIQTRTTEQSALEKAIADKAGQQATLQTTIGALERRLPDLEHQAEAGQERLKAIQESIRDANDAAKQATEAHKKASEEVRGAEEQLRQMQQTITKQIAYRDGLKQTIDQMEFQGQSRNNDLNTEWNNRNLEIQRLADAIEQQQELIGQRREDVRQYTDLRAAAQQRLAEVASSIAREMARPVVLPKRKVRMVPIKEIPVIRSSRRQVRRSAPSSGMSSEVDEPSGGRGGPGGDDDPSSGGGGGGGDGDGSPSPSPIPMREMDWEPSPQDGPDFNMVRDPSVTVEGEENAIINGKCALRGECENKLAAISTKDLAAIWKGIGGEPPDKGEVSGKGELRQWYCDKVNKIDQGSADERDLRHAYCEALHARLYHKMVASIEQFPDPYYTDGGATKSSKQYAQEIGALLESKAKMPRPNLLGPGCDTHITKEGLIKLTSYQEFVRNYFRPDAPMKGLLLWHSTGSGKTCSLLAATSATWEVDPKPWSIILSASSSIITGFVKNVFDMVCHSGMQSHLLAEARRKGRAEVDTDRYKNMSTAEKAKTFAQLFGGCKGWVTEKTQSAPQLQAWKHSRLKTFLMGKAYGQADWAEIQRCRKKNEAENGQGSGGDPKDPLRRCLVIIDEVHSFIDSQFYDGASGKFLESDWDQMMRMITRSYSNSGENSVRFLVLSATPQKSHPANLFRIINMLSERPTLPTSDSAYEAWVQDFESEAAEPLLPPNVRGSDIRQCSRDDHVCQYMNAWYATAGPDVRQGDKYPSKAFHFFSAARGILSYVDVSHDPSKVPHVTRTRNVFVRVSNRQVKAIQTCLDKFGGKMAKSKSDKSTEYDATLSARKKSKPWEDDEYDDDDDDEYDDDDFMDYLKARKKGKGKDPWGFTKNKKENKEKKEKKEKKDKKDKKKGSNAIMSLGKCIRARATFAEDASSYFFDSSNFNSDRLLAEMRYLSPVISQLLVQIMKYDQEDVKKWGYVYRHIVYAPDPVILRLALSCFIAADFSHVVFNKGENLGLRTTAPSPYWGVAAISTEAAFWRHKMTAPFIDAVRGVFNDLRGNENGERLRILLIDSTMSEGVDLKPAHFHFIEPTKSDAMLKRLAPSLKNKVFEDTEYAQVIGRATRLCGGSGGLKGLRWFESPHTIDGQPVPYNGSGVACGMSQQGEFLGGKCIPQGWVVTVDRYYPVFDRETQRTFQARMPLELELSEKAISSKQLRYLGAQEMIKNLAILAAADRVLNSVQEEMALQDQPDEVDLFTTGTSSANFEEVEAEEPDREVKEVKKRMASRGEEFIEGYHTRRAL